VERTYGNKDTVLLASWFSLGIGMTVIIPAKGTKGPTGPKGMTRKNTYTLL
jgi:hypothetical protein